MDSLFGDKLDRLLSDEQTMGKIREIANSLQGASAQPSGGAPPRQEPSSPPKPPPRPSKIGGYCAILSAVKPYLDSARRERVDKTLRALKIAETAQTFIAQM